MNSEASGYLCDQSIRKIRCDPLGRITLVNDSYRKGFDDIEVRKVEQTEKFEASAMLTNGS